MRSASAGEVSSSTTGAAGRSRSDDTRSPVRNMTPCAAPYEASASDSAWAPPRGIGHPPVWPAPSISSPKAADVTWSIGRKAWPLIPAKSDLAAGRAQGQESEPGHRQRMAGQADRAEELVGQRLPLVADRPEQPPPGRP